MSNDFVHGGVYDTEEVSFSKRSSTALSMGLEEPSLALQAALDPCRFRWISQTKKSRLRGWLRRRSFIATVDANSAQAQPARCWPKARSGLGPPYPTTVFSRSSFALSASLLAPP